MNIFLSVYYNNNLGDDLMIYLLGKRYPEHQFFISNHDMIPDHVCDLKNITILDSITPTQHQIFLRTINKGLSFVGIPKLQWYHFFHQHHFDIYLQVGGSIFMQTTKRAWINKIRDYELAISKCKYSMIIGCNFGPYFTNSFRNRHEQFFEKLDFLSFRDLYSYQLFQKLSNAHCYPDLIFHLEKKQSDLSGTFLISVVGWQNKGIQGFQKAYVEMMVDLIRSLLPNYSIILMAFCRNEGDMITCKHILQYGKFTEDQVKVYCHQTVEHSLSLFSSAAGIVATRFHANILGLHYEIPMLPVIYSEKTEHELDDLEVEGYRWDLRKQQSLNLKEALECFTHRPIFNKNKIKDVQKHFLFLDQVLNHESE